MNAKLKHLHLSWLQVLIIVVLVLGIFFRFVNLDRKVYWIDETATSIRISGYTWEELNAELDSKASAGRVIGVKDILEKYQSPHPEKSVIDTIKGLAIDEPQHPPLYYAIARFWVDWFGNSVAVKRSLSAIFSLLVFPCAYWLCVELFESSFVAWVAVAILAVSPFHLLYAQQARQYSLWTATILLSCAALLRAMRLQTKSSWGIYAASVALGFYTFLLSALVTLGHGIYLVILERFRWTKTFKNYLLASLAGLVAFAPWILIVIANYQQIQTTTGHTNKRVAFFSLASTWVGNISRLFIDLDFNGDSLNSVIPLIPIILFCIFLFGYSIYFLCKTTPPRVWLFVVILTGLTAIAFILPDLIIGGRRSTAARYLIPSFLGIQLAVSYLLATKINPVSLTTKRKTLWKIIAVGVISGGVLSCAVSLQAEAWWHKYHSVNNPTIAKIINQSPSPLVVMDRKNLELFSLSYLLDPKVQLLLIDEPKTPKIPGNFSDVFLFNPSKSLRNRLAKEYKIEPADKPGSLWQLNKK